MEFVFTSWYFVIIALIAGIVACLVVYVQMDKKDRQIISDYVKSNQAQAESEKAEAESGQLSQEVKSEENNN